MSRKIDLTSEQFGLLTVLSENPERTKGGNIKWDCVCDCGARTSVCGAHLTNGNTKSCGCLAKTELTGQRFGLLTVLSENPERSGMYVQWNCICDCGAHALARGANLISGNTKSCGCLVKKDLTGLRFGCLTVLSESPERSRRCIQWNCICDCGGYKMVIGERLMSGNTKSCGCQTTKIKLTGRRFGWLTVLSENPERTKQGCVRWNCICDCGTYMTVAGISLMVGHTKSCGCLFIATHMTRHSILSPDDIPIEMIRAMMEITKIRKFIKKVS